MRKRLLIILSISLPLFMVYLVTLPRWVYWQDAGVYLAAIKTLGIAYPPGFPLYIILAYLWTKIFWWVDFVVVVHSCSAVAASLAAGFVGLAVFELAQNTVFAGPAAPVSRSSFRAVRDKVSLSIQSKALTQGNSSREPSGASPVFIIVAIFTGWITGLAYSLWSQAINAEVYTLHGLFVAVVTWLVVRIHISSSRHPEFISGSPKGSRNQSGMTGASVQHNTGIHLLLLAIIYGLSYGNHPATVALLPVLLFWAWQEGILDSLLAWIGFKVGKGTVSIKFLLLLLTLFILAAATPYSYLLVRGRQNPDFSWTKITTVSELVYHISGKAYFTEANSWEWLDKEKLLTLPRLFYEEYFWGIAIGVIGIIGLIGKERKLFMYFTLAIMSILLLVAFYERGTEYNYWLIHFYILFAIMIGLGGLYLFQFRRWTGLISLICLISLIGKEIQINYPLNNRANYQVAEDFGKNLIGNLPQNSVFFTIGDQESAIPLYLQQVRGFRKDIIIVSTNTFAYSWQRRDLYKKRPDLSFPPESGQDVDKSAAEEMINEFAKANISATPIFTITRNYITWDPELSLIPAGAIFMLSDDPEREVDKKYWDYSFNDPEFYKREARAELSQKLPDGKISRVAYFSEAQKFLLQAQKNLGDWYWEKGESEQARQAYRRMFEIDSKLELPEIRKRIEL